MNVLFAVVFFICLILPGVTMELGKEVKSEIDNEYLPEIEISSLKEFPSSFSTYVDKRIGFRQEALSLYQKINDSVFSVMEHPAYMYGENGYVYHKDSKFIRNFQHLNLNEEYAEEFSDALLGFQTYAQDQGMDFLYFYIPDKETVYPEFYPKGINVYGDISRTDQILQALDEKGVNHYYAKDAMVEGKKTFQVNNVKFDSGHWNEHGAYVAIRQLYSILQERYPQLQLIEQGDYHIEYVLKKSLQTSHFEINEEVPVYSLKETNAKNRTKKFKKRILISYPNNHVCRYVNPDCKDQPKLLIFGDSYLAGMEHFFINNFSEYTYIHRYNVYNQEFFEYYVDQIKPDIVIFENPERSHTIDLYKSETVSEHE